MYINIKMPYQQVLDKIFCVVTDEIPFVARKVKVSILDFSEQRILTIATRQTLVPAAIVVVTFAVKWRIAAQHNIPAQ